jgi:tetratricopeptide (TPR) repeat protein
MSAEFSVEFSVPADHALPAAPALAGLPRPSGTFIGRRAEVDALLTDLAPMEAGEDQERPLVAEVAGLPGVGKTELVLQTAWRALGEPGWFPGGVLFIDLFGYDERRRVAPERALEEFLRALGASAEDIPPGLQARSRLFRSMLAASARRGARVLVIVDNAATAEQVRPLLPSDGATAALITSRHTLDVGARLHDLGVLTAEESVDLIRRVLRQARGASDHRVDGQLPAAERIADLCGNLPLAVHICAALLADLPARPLSSLVDALADAHRRLDGMRRGERAVRAAFDLSYRHLTDRQSHLFRLLPLVPGPDVSTGAAAALIDAEAAEVEPLLQQLATAHLVDAGAAWGRWRMHDLVRLYADERGQALGAQDRWQTALSRVYRYFGTRLYDAADTHFTRGPAPEGSAFFGTRGEAVAWLESEREGLTAACLAARAFDPSITYALAERLARFLDHHRYLDDWVAVSGAALDAARSLGDRGKECAALQLHGLALREVGRLAESGRAHERDLRLRREDGDRFGESLALDNLGLVARHLGRTDEAIAAHTQALQILTELGRTDEASAVRANLGNALRQAGRPEEAVEAIAAAVERSRTTGHGHSEALALGNLGGALTEAGRAAEALAACADALRLSEELGDTYAKALALASRGRALKRLGRPDEAVGTFIEAVALFRGLREQMGESSALLQLGTLYSDSGRPADAVEALTRAAGLLRESGRRHGLGAVLAPLSRALKEAERFEEAIATAVEALGVHRASGDLEGQAQTLALLGELFLATDLVEQGAAVYAEAADLFHTFGDRPLAEGIARQTLGWLLLRLGGLEESAEADTRAAALFREAGDPVREGLALDDLARSYSLLERWDEAIEAGTRAVGVLHTTDSRRAEGRALQNLGAYLRVTEEWAKSAEATGRAVDMFRDLADPLLEGHALHNLGPAQLSSGEHAEAVRSCTRAAALLHTTDDRLGEGEALFNLGTIQAALGDFAPGAAALSRAADLFHALGEADLETHARAAEADARARAQARIAADTQHP